MDPEPYKETPTLKSYFTHCRKSEDIISHSTVEPQKTPVRGKANGTYKPGSSISSGLQIKPQAEQRLAKKQTGIKNDSCELNLGFWNPSKHKSPVAEPRCPKTFNDIGELPI